MVERPFKLHDAGEELRDLAADAKSELVLDFAESAFVEVHLPDGASPLGQLALHFVAEDAQGLADLLEPFARIALAGAVLDRRRERGAGALQFLDGLLDIRERLPQRGGVAPGVRPWRLNGLLEGVVDPGFQGF